MANKQPFYHRATILFTATREVPQEEVEAIIFKIADVVEGTVVIEEYDEPEAGDPHDLM